MFVVGVRVEREVGEATEPNRFVVGGESPTGDERVITTERVSSSCSAGVASVGIGRGRRFGAWLGVWNEEGESGAGVDDDEEGDSGVGENEEEDDGDTGELTSIWRGVIFTFELEWGVMMDDEYGEW